MELNFQGLAAVAALKEARRVESAAVKASKAAGDAVKSLLGAERVGTIAGVTVVTRQEITRKDIDRKALAADYPEVFAAVQTTGTYDKLVIA